MAAKKKGGTKSTTPRKSSARKSSATKSTTESKTARKRGTQVQTAADRDALAATPGTVESRARQELRDINAKGEFELAQDRAVSKEEEERRLEGLTDAQRKRRTEKPEELVPEIEVDKRTGVAYQPVVRPGGTEPIIPPVLEGDVPHTAKAREAGATDRKLALAEEVEPDPLGAGRMPHS